MLSKKVLHIQIIVVFSRGTAFLGRNLIDVFLFHIIFISFFATSDDTFM